VKFLKVPMVVEGNGALNGISEEKEEERGGIGLLREGGEDV
jgi:hypothetical protein